MEKVAKGHGLEVPITAIVLAYLMTKASYVIPLIGGRTVEHLKGNVEALKVKLTNEQIAILGGCRAVRERISP